MLLSSAFGFFWSAGRPPWHRPARRRYPLRRSRPVAPRLERLEARNLPSFVGPVNYYERQYADGVAVGDFNGDGIPDLVTANRNNDYGVSVLLGNGDGSFQPPRDSAAGGASSAVVVGDFNGDGKLDVAVALDGPTNAVAVLLGYGDGTFHEPRIYDAGESPVALAVGDFNGDGIPDLVTVNYGNAGDGHTASVFLGNGDGTFQPARSYEVGPSPVSVAVGDFNGDGIPDLVVANENYGPLTPPRVNLLLGNGDGSFRPPVTYNVGTLPGSSDFAAVGDFNGDGKLDVAVASYSNSTVAVLLGNGDGTFRAPRSYDAGVLPTFLAVGDFNGDGTPDLAAVGSSGVNLLLANGDGSFQAPVLLAAGSGPAAAAVGDFNGDGKLDLAVTNSGSADVSVLLGNGDGTFPAVPSFGAGSAPASVAVGDFNGDGIPDLAVANSGSGTVSVLLGNGDGTFRRAVSYSAGGAASYVTIGDFNGDGILDLVVTGPGLRGSATTVSILLGNGDGTFRSPLVADAGQGPLAVAVGDFNGDGIPDLVVADRGSGSLVVTNSGVSVLLGNGDGTFQSPVLYGSGWRPTAVAVGDLNGDGKLDVAVASGTGLHLLLGNGDGSFQVRNLAGASANAVVLADLNGDGLLDIVTVGSVVTVYLGNGDGTFLDPLSFFCGGSGYSVAVGDFNGDGTPDLAVATGGGVNVLSGNGDGTFQISVNSYRVGAGPVAVAAGDFNGDGLLDLVTANSFSNDVSVLLNTP